MPVPGKTPSHSLANGERKERNHYDLVGLIRLLMARRAGPAVAWPSPNPVPAKTDVVSLVFAAAKAAAGETLAAEEQALIDANSERPGPQPRAVENPAELAAFVIRCGAQARGEAA
jgi:hypothetical protein